MKNRLSVFRNALNDGLKSRVLADLKIYLADNCQAWELQSDGSYIKREPVAGENPRPAQSVLLAAMTGTPAS